MKLEVSHQAAALWAKKRSEEGHQYWLPLIAHLIDTQNVINFLFNNWLSPRQKRILIDSSSEEFTQKLVKFVGFVHDIGKSTPAFQIKKSYDGDTLLDDEMKAQLSRVGFLKFDEASLSSANKSQHARAGEAIVENFKVPESIGAIIGGHHGKPETDGQVSQLKHYTANYWQSDNDSAVQTPWQRVQRELFDYGLASSGYQSVTEIPDIKQPQAVILEGLLIMADWLASSEYLDQDKTKPLFPLIDVDQTWQDLKMKTRFKDAMITWQLDGEWIPQRVSLDGSKDPYEQRWGFKAHLVQAAMTKAIGEATDPGIAIVEAPMGLGKTEIALVAAEQMAYASGCDGIFMGLPTQATTNAMFKRVNDWLEAVAKRQHENFAIRLMHGKAQFNPTYQGLPNATNIHDNDTKDDSGSVVTNDWFSGKKSILTKFTVGTIDNLLLMGLKQKHLFLRHLGFSGKVVIIDEVHAYDAYMNQYLYKAIEWLGAYHIPIVILSATLPKEKREALLEAYLKGKYGLQYKKQLKAPDDWQETQAYPLLSLLDGCEIKQVKPASGQKPVKVQVENLNVPDDELIAKVVGQLEHGGVAGIIVNTVKRAQQLAQLVPADMPSMVLHSAFLATDRSDQEAELQAAIGKDGTRPEKLIVIGTQVLEQSLDIDFDVLYTDIAPMDLVLQRIGRLHRHSLSRPKALQQPKVYLMGIQNTDDYGAGNEAVYGKYLLMKTAHFMPETITLPTDISPLVQKVYDEQSDTEIAGIEPARLKFEADLKKEKTKAKKFQINNPKLKPGKTIHGWLDRDFGPAGRDEQKANAAVRDIKETLEVILVKRTTEGDFLLNGHNLTVTSAKDIAKQVVRLPLTITPGPKQIDQVIDILEDLTSKAFPAWQDNMWLKGALALPLDQNCSTVLMGWRLSYSAALGLQIEKEGEHDE